MDETPLKMPQRVQIKSSPNDTLSYAELLQKAVDISGLKNGNAVMVKRSIDARHEPIFIYNLDVYGPGEAIEIVDGFKLQNVSAKPEVHIIGFGPAGIFAAMQLIELGIKPVIIERGKDVRKRRFDLAKLVKDHEVNPDSNYCFGEGGAGTYSDGKLYTRSNKRGPVKKVLKSLTEFGATEEILWDAHPHIGTNKLPGIIENYRKVILECGGEIHFEQRVTGIRTQSQSVVAIELGAISMPVKHVILATGHSARDVFELLYRENILIESKPFAIGVRLEHHQSLIDQIQYHCETKPLGLPPASYSLVEQIQGRGVFSFCMCPGGIIAPASTSPGEIVVNGWSPSKRNGEFANSGFVVAVDDKDFLPFAKHGPLSALHYQSFYEKLAFETQGNLTAPAQRIEDFIQKKNSSTLPQCSYLPGITSRMLDEVLSEAVAARIRQAMVEIGKKLKGFRTNDAIMVGVESRTSSPVKIPRDKEGFFHPQMLNFYPCGEGAGYAGGIMSAALDGLRVANALYARLAKDNAP